MGTVKINIKDSLSYQDSWYNLESSAEDKSNNEGGGEIRVSISVVTLSDSNNSKKKIRIMIFSIF